MVSAVNQLITQLIREKYDLSVDLHWFTPDRITKLELLIQNLERIKSRPDLKNLKLDSLLAYLSPLLSYYKRKITYKQFLKIANYASAETINKQIDQVVTNLRGLLRYLYVEQILEELHTKNVRKELIEEAMMVPDLRGGIDNIKHHILQSIHAFGTVPLDKEVIFKLSVLRIATHLHAEKLKLPDVKVLRKFYEEKKGPSNYQENREVAIIVKSAIVRLNELYPRHKKLFLARDGLILYEAQYTLFRDNCDVIYISRDTLGVFFKVLEKELGKAIEDEGMNDVEKIIRNLRNRYHQLQTNPRIKEIIRSLVRYLTPYLSSKTVFVDSSSRSLPVILSALCSLYFPEKEYKVFFCTTIYTDPRAGYILGEEKNYVVDMIPDYVQFHAEKSSLIPYVAKLLPHGGKMMKQPQAYTAHLILQSILHT
ncbi:hypothetical protein HY495_00985 [Candidatus Woesearchaeota archaeon]|nr:hypothetical protein [Candidatus Woesearchaeota archaeon]